MLEHQKPWKVEYAKSSRSSCKTCKSTISKESLRFGKMVQATQFDGLMPMWNHATCILKKSKLQIKSIDDIEGIEQLRWEDQQKIRSYLEGSASQQPKAEPVKIIESGIEVSTTSRATCKQCNQKILKGEVRLSTKPEGQGAKGLAWHHAKCYLEFSPSTQLTKLLGWQTLSESDQEALSSMIKEVPGIVKSGKQVEEKDGKSMQKSSKAGAKRKVDDSLSEKFKVAKTEGLSTCRHLAIQGGCIDSEKQDKKENDLDKKLEVQTKQLWALKDDLQKHVTTTELREMLEANNQDSTGSELDLRYRCADGMMFGALSGCPLCSGSLRYSSGMYRCHGYLSAWSKCTFSSCDPERIKGKWKLPEDTDNDYLTKWFKSQKAGKPARILPVQTLNGNQASQSLNREILSDFKVAISGLSKETTEEWKTKIEGAGGFFHDKIKKDTNFLVLSGSPDDHITEIRKARRTKVPIVREDYLVACFRKQKMLPFDLYKFENAGEGSGMVTVRVKGQSAVHALSGLQDFGHILEDGKCIYNTTLNMSDLATGINSYYILQIIQDDKSLECYVFRKWGRVGNEKIGGNKLEKMSKSDAISDFKRLFLEKTGNSWEAWEQKTNFKKQPGRFFPLDIDFGVNRKVVKKNPKIEASELAPSLAELMKMLFSVDTYRATMMEFEINLSEMPLGKLSKNNIQKGFEALTEIQNLLNGNTYDPSVKESLIVDASNRFFTVIPSIHPHVIRDEDDFKSKVKMLEALRDIEVASRVIGFDVDSDDSLDDNYKKLNCDIVPLTRDSTDFQLIEKYLLTTHAPTHKDWTLELEDVFSLDRAGEYDQFRPHREKLGNKMLLWHGSRLTNFVGILSQGLRIAPPEAPTTGYMFGKGIYFADLVSKSAQYCYTDKRNPVGLMLLSEVALGEVHELKKAEYMEKPPEGKHSTKGLGKKIPQASEYVNWKDDVVVPSGKPVGSNIRTSELMYNEYIVYDAAQVKMQFLLKVRFHHKR